MENIELEDLVYTYPEYNIEGIQTFISAKEEFREVGAQMKEPVPKRGQLFRHQKFFKRAMLQYDNMLMTWSPGTGKGCGFIAVTEHYKALASALEDFRVENQQFTVPYKRAYILVKGDSLANEIKHQILCKCTDGDYITDQIINSKTETARKSNITRSLNKFYTITTYGTFAKTLLKLNDSQLRQEFDHCLFIVDEVHNINNESTTGVLTKDPITGNSYYIRMEGDKPVIVESRLIYDQLWRLFHTVSPRKVMLLSATPMINTASEIGDRLNLILPRDNQIPDNLNYKTLTLEEFEPYIRGIVSYVRELDTGAIPVYQGDIMDVEYDLSKTFNILGGKGTEGDESEIPSNIVKSQMEVYISEMLGKQSSVYKQAVEDPMSLRPESRKPEAFGDLQRQVANFVFPDNSTGVPGYKKFVKENGNNFEATPELYKWISSPEKLRSISCKFYEIMRLCKNEPGNCWCYTDYVRGSGAIVLGLCLEANGFERFDEDVSVFSSGGGTTLAPVCGGKSLDDADLQKGRKIRISKKLRYGLLISETMGSSAPLLELFNSYENRHGEYIKAIIGSPTTRDGLNFANVLQIHLVGPGWNQSSTYQAESRAIRSTSHVDLIEEERQRLIANGQDPSNASVKIKVYRHAAVDEEGQSIDISMYQFSEVKDREIRRIMRMLKQVSIDCQVNYSRNVRRTDKDGSAACDYSVCAYKCFDPVPNYVDYSSYDVLYSSDIVEEIKLEIIDIFRVVFLVSYPSLYEELSGYRRKFVDLAVASLIENKIPIIDRYGYISYLREDRGNLFLRRDYPLGLNEEIGAVSLSEYTSNLIGIETMTLNNYVGLIQRGHEASILDSLKGINVKSKEFAETIDKLTLENKFLVVETAISNYIEGSRTSITDAIMNLFKSNIFYINEPSKALEIARQAKASRGQGRGRKAKAGSKFKLTETEQEKVEETLNKLEKNKKQEIIYFHNLSTATTSLTKYAVTAKSRPYSGKIRLLKKSENIGWRDANEYEEVVYNAVIKTKLQAAESEIEHEIYGTLKGDIFRIIDKTTEDTEMATKDTRKVNRGRNCNTWNMIDLYDVLYKIEFNPFVNIEIELSREQLIDYLVNNQIGSEDEIDEFDDDKLEFYYLWLQSGAGKREICRMLQEEFASTGRLFEQ